MNGNRLRFEKLGQDAQHEVEGLRTSIFYRWPTPAVPAEGKLDWDDDLAVLFVEYGFSILEGAISWHRQNTERRPSVAAIRERCVMARTKDREGMSDSDAKYNEHMRQVRVHLGNPANRDFVPFAMIYRDVIEYNALKKMALAQGNFSEDDARRWWDWRNKKTDEEWAEMRSRGVKQVVVRRPDQQQIIVPRRAGSQHMSSVGEIATQSNLALGE